ncbi:MAG: AMP-binding protein, partial [Caldithrix sp.]|nr:AMP-binding protein [Caldithrix sp.]
MKQSQKKFSNSDLKPDTLVDLLQWRASTQPHERAYTYLKDGDKKEIHLTYGELDNRARSIAASLQAKGLQGERALLLYPPGLDYISGFFGCLYAGVIAVPAYPPDPNRLNRSLPRLQAIVNDAKASVALTSDSILYMIRMLKLGNKITGTIDKLPFLRKFRTTMKYFASTQGVVAESRELGDLQWISTDSLAQGFTDQWHDPDVNKDTIAFLQYTSGSTGTPKGVILTHDNLLHNSDLIYQSTNYDKESEAVFWLPIYHDMGLIGGVLQPLYGEVPSTLMSPVAFLQRPLKWLETISRIEKTTGSAAPNFAYELCIKKATPERVKELDLSRWIFALSGAEPVRHQTIERFSEVFKDAGFKKEAFFPAYGLAEATLFVTGGGDKKGPLYTTVDKSALKKNTIIEVPPTDTNGQTLVSSGQGKSAQVTKIVNPDTFIECHPGEIGEIWVKGPSVSQGYYERPTETKETFHNFIKHTNEGPFLRTGDLAFQKNGEIFVTGRVKDLIIIRGTNHYPQDIELTVEKSHSNLRPGCTAAFTIDEDDEEKLVIVQEVRQSKNIDTDEIFQNIREAIHADHELQTHTIVLIKARSINKTSSGKIQRRATKNDFLENQLAEVDRWVASKGHIVRSKKLIEQEITEEKPDAKIPESTQSPSGKSARVKHIEQIITDLLSQSLEAETHEIDIRQPFVNFGLDSAQAVGLVGDLEEQLNTELSPTLIWDYPTIEAMAKFLAEEETPATKGVEKRAKHWTDYE